MTATVTQLRQPRYNPQLERHGWDSEDKHRCLFCGLLYRSEQDPTTRAWSKRWRWPNGDVEAGRSLPKCPGPDHDKQANTDAPASPPAAPVVEPAADGRTGDCCRCTPPCGRPTRLYLGGRLCQEQADAAAEAARRGDAA